MGFYSCAKNSDEIDDGGGNNNNGIVDLEPEEVYGKWQVYYSTKLVVERPGTSSQKVFTTFRAIDLDGFTFELYKEGDEFRVKGYNGIGVQTSEGWYEVKDKDSIIFHLDSITPDKEIIKNWKREGRKVLEEPKDGIIKWDLTYKRLTKDGTEYRVKDVYANRNVNTNPTANNGVNPAKAKIDYDDLARGKWVVSAVYIYYDNTLQPVASGEEQKIIKGTSYAFSVNSEGEKEMRMTDGVTGNVSDYPVYIVDDVINYVYKNEEDKDDSFSTWIERFDNDNNTFYDIKSARYEGDLSVVIKKVWRFDREL